MVNYEINCIIKYIKDFGFEEMLFFDLKNKFEYYKEEIYNFLSKGIYATILLADIFNRIFPVKYVIRKHWNKKIYCLKNSKGDIIKKIEIHITGNICPNTQDHLIDFIYFQHSWLSESITLKCGITSTSSNLTLIHKLLLKDSEISKIIRDRKLKSILS